VVEDGPLGGWLRREGPYDALVPGLVISANEKMSPDIVLSAQSEIGESLSSAQSLSLLASSDEEVLSLSSLNSDSEDSSSFDSPPSSFVSFRACFFKEDRSSRGRRLFSVRHTGHSQLPGGHLVMPAHFLVRWKALGQKSHKSRSPPSPHTESPNCYSSRQKLSSNLRNCPYGFRCQECHLL